MTSIIERSREAAQRGRQMAAAAVARGEEEYRRYLTQCLKETLARLGIDAEPDGPTIEIDRIRFRFDMRYADGHLIRQLLIVAECERCGREVVRGVVEHIAHIVEIVDSGELPPHRCGELEEDWNFPEPMSEPSDE